jgi:type II secretory pathway pseudopilin PulG
MTLKVENWKSEVGKLKSRNRKTAALDRLSSLVTRLSHKGFTYITLLVVLTIIGISLGAAGKYWSNVILREKEEELLFRGDQYRQAIERYYLSRPGLLQYPQNIDDLLQDNRTPTARRHLRQKYKDPMTNEDFVVIKDPLTNRIMGVHSASDKESLKRSGFPEIYNDFASKSTYSEWQFVSTIMPVQPPGSVPGGTLQRLPLVIPPPPGSHSK